MDHRDQNEQVPAPAHPEGKAEGHSDTTQRNPAVSAAWITAIVGGVIAIIVAIIANVPSLLPLFTDDTASTRDRNSVEDDTPPPEDDDTTSPPDSESPGAAPLRSDCDSSSVACVQEQCAMRGETGVVELVAGPVSRVEGGRLVLPVEIANRLSSQAIGIPSRSDIELPPENYYNFVVHTSGGQHIPFDVDETVWPPQGAGGADLLDDAISLPSGGSVTGQLVMRPLGGQVDLDELFVVVRIWDGQAPACPSELIKAGPVPTPPE